MSEPTTTHLEILGTVKRNERSYWTRIGVAFPTKDGRGYRLQFDYFPAAADTGLLLLPPSQKEPTDDPASES